MRRSAEILYTAEQMSDEYHDRFTDSLDELQNMNGDTSIALFEHVQMYTDRMQVLSEFWDLIAERLKG